MVLYVERGSAYIDYLLYHTLSSTFELIMTFLIIIFLLVRVWYCYYICYSKHHHSGEMPRHSDAALLVAVVTLATAELTDVRAGTENRISINPAPGSVPFKSFESDRGLAT